MPKTTTPRTEKELRAAGLHVSFELRQMVDATADLAEHDGGRVADLESGLLHAPNLIEFLTEWPGSKITAGDFLPGWKPLSAKRFDVENRRLRGLRRSAARGPQGLVQRFCQGGSDQAREDVPEDETVHADDFRDRNDRPSVQDTRLVTLA